MHQSVNQVPRTFREKTGFYLLPSLFTFSALFFAFFAITEAMEFHYDHVGWAMVACLLLDGLDGRVARWTGKQGRFGEELDSIADMVSFGVAPSLIMYIALLQPLGKLGYLVMFIYCVCAAMRLALFNTLIGIADKKWFMGLPSPSAASLVIGFIWVWHNFFPTYEHSTGLGTVFTLFAAFSMVVPIKFWSFKGIEDKRLRWYNNGLIFFTLFLLCTTVPSVVYFSFFLIYVLASYLGAIVRYSQGAKNFPI
ncbi:MAG: phosphatidylcholine/phosphatidylserine synthase [Neisseriaceae bacterium]